MDARCHKTGARQLRIIFCTPIGADGDSGKERATRQKSEAILRQYPGSKILTGDRVCKRPKILRAFLIELWAIITIIANSKNFDIYHLRNGHPIFSIFIAKAVGLRVYREIHADGLEEVKFLEKSVLEKIGIILNYRVSLLWDRLAEKRIFNNPRLQDAFRKRGIEGSEDIVVYNGGDEGSASKLDRKTARERWGLEEKKRYLVFAGSASIWHGIPLMVELQREFSNNEDNIQIIVAGGQVDRCIDVDRVLVNFPFINARDCAQLIRAADVCLLPVADIRVSPGSPLKLYDYMVNDRAVIAQANCPGYSDEVQRFGAGICVDFNCPCIARQDIVNFLNDARAVDQAISSLIRYRPQYLWDMRVTEWFDTGLGVRRDEYELY